MQANKDQSPDRPSPSTSTKRTSRPKRIWLWIIVILAVFFLLRAVGEKIFSTREAARVTRETARPNVSVIHPKTSNAQKELVLPGSVQALADTPIFARTSGYVQRWLVDIGARVRQGQLLAEIESPEVDQQLNQALGDVQQAQADADLAQITTQRWKQMLAKNTVSRQEADEKQGNFDAKQANLIAAKANVERLRELKGFERIYAPFDGVITARNVNVGDLITANNTGQKEMFRIADDSQLRVYLSVPENAASFIKVGQPATVVLASSPGIVATGRVANIASAIDPQSRTMLTEVRVDNAKHAFLSGGYATISFDLKLAKPPVTVPVNTLLFRPEGTVVGVVGEDSRVSLRKVEIGRDFGNYVEITEGIAPTDRIIVNPSDSLLQGDLVRVEKDVSKK